MSVQVNTYVIHGYSFGYDEFKTRYKDRDGDSAYDKIESICDSAFEGINNTNGLTALFDGMSGNYVIVGHVIAKTGDGSYFEDPIETTLTDQMQEMVAGLLNLFFKEDGYFSADEIKTYVVSHYR